MVLKKVAFCVVMMTSWTTAGAVTSGVQTQEQHGRRTQIDGALEDSRNTKYCEINWGGPDYITVMMHAFDQTCPDSPGYYDVTEEDIRAVHGDVPFVSFNGIREWLISSSVAQNTDTIPPEYYQEYGTNIFPDGSGFLTFRLAIAHIEVKEPYVEGFPARHQTMIWNAGTTVYELVPPDCSAIYVMQSFKYGRPGDMVLLNGEDDLPTLWEDLRINPPPGWIYRSRVTDVDIVIEGKDGITPVIRDDVSSSYSRMDDGWDTSLCP